ncbi:branched-chain amino acid aminotransferase [Bacilli bacterium PM5-3]|nr:branched-chain amino acid aminotransferase [Bacilli bacterium PM5-3]
MEDTIKFIENKNKRKKADTPPAFGTTFTNYMFEMKYNNQDGWHNATIKPYEAFTIEPSALCFHYGQTIFEGLKVLKTNNKRILFRADANLKRLNDSAKRMCMPEIDVDFVLKALVELIKKEEDNWFYDNIDSYLYIRPFMIASEAIIGARQSKEYIFMIIMSPMSTYFTSDKVKLTTETHYMRVPTNGTGEVKNGGNYGGAFYATANANKNGYNQVLWLDPHEQKYIEEAGMMNVFFIVDNKIITPNTSGSILKGITRDSVINIAPELGYEVEEKKIDIDNLVELYKQGRVLEAFATGTAASIQPLDIINHNGFEMEFIYDENSVSTKVYDYLENIKKGLIKDKFNYIIEF